MGRSNNNNPPPLKRKTEKDESNKVTEENEKAACDARIHQLKSDQERLSEQAKSHFASQFARLQKRMQTEGLPHSDYLKACQNSLHNDRTAKTKAGKSFWTLLLWAMVAAFIASAFVTLLFSPLILLGYYATAAAFCPWPDDATFVNGTLFDLNEQTFVYRNPGYDVVIPSLDPSFEICQDFYYFLFEIIGPDVFDAWMRTNVGTDYREVSCWYQVPTTVTMTFRPPVDCDLCARVIDIPRLSNLSKQEFAKYAFTMQPIIVTDATKDWTALDNFSLSYFKHLYRDVIGLEKLSKESNVCNFFPYNTAHDSLYSVFTTDLSEAERWYVGWANCANGVVKDYLRSEYSKPYFLPEDYKETHTDWLFIGTPGPGAPMHQDNVKDPSWQAQIKGKKKWTLEPPAECSDICKSFEVVVNTGEVIVLDTYRWFHMTEALEGDMSITIGSEFTLDGGDQWDTRTKL